VQAYLERKGLNAPMTAEGKAAREPVVTCKGRKPTKALTACLQPNRRVELEITGVKR
jgi:OmpA-OmpF porin, OOP family